MGEKKVSGRGAVPRGWGTKAVGEGGWGQTWGHDPCLWPGSLADRGWVTGEVGAECGARPLPVPWDQGVGGVGMPTPVPSPPRGHSPVAGPRAAAGAGSRHAAAAPEPPAGGAGE